MGIKWWGWVQNILPRHPLVRIISNLDTLLEVTRSKVKVTRSVNTGTENLLHLAVGEAEFTWGHSSRLQSVLAWEKFASHEPGGRFSKHFMMNFWSYIRYNEVVTNLTTMLIFERSYDDFMILSQDSNLWTQICDNNFFITLNYDCFCKT